VCSSDLVIVHAQATFLFDVVLSIWDVFFMDVLSR